MRGITISDSTPDGFLDVNLIDILEIIAPAISTTQWQITNLECLGTTAEKLEQLADDKQLISSELLLQLATEITQIVDGKFQGYFLNENQPWLIIAAVDSSAYDVETVDENILNQIRQQFQQISELPTLLTV